MFNPLHAIATLCHSVLMDCRISKLAAIESKLFLLQTKLEGIKKFEDPNKTKYFSYVENQMRPEFEKLKCKRDNLIQLLR